MIYKLCRKLDTGDYASIQQWEGSLIYPIGEWVRPRVGMIFAFRSLGDAQAFAFYYPVQGFRILCGQATGVRDIGIVYAGGYTMEHISGFWHQERSIMAPAPHGTVCCQSVLLESEV